MSAETLGDLLAEHGLRPKHYRAGSSHRLKCPRCNAKDEDSFSLVIDQDGRGFTGNCHRGKCGHTVGAKLRDKSSPEYRPRAEYRPAPVAQIGDEPSFTTYAWFDRRGIKSDTVDWFGAYSSEHKFYDKKIHDAIVWPYRYGGAIVNRKFRAMDDKGLMGQEFQPLPTLFNVDALGDEPDEIIWVEGECDVMAIHQAGYPMVVSLKDGAPNKVKDEDDPRREDDKRFEALNTHQGVLKHAVKHILAGDMDEPGEVLRLELARRLGRHTCWIVTWPEGCKDANDCLQKFGEAGVRAALGDAKPYPIEGVQRASGELLDRYLLLPAPPTLKTGIDSVDEVVKIPGEGKVIIVTGMPNSGKTQWTMNVAVNQMKLYGRKWAVFSPECAPWEEYLTQAAQIAVGKPARAGRLGLDKAYLMTREERRQAGDWLNDKLFYLEAESLKDAPTLTWIFDTTALLILRFGVTDLLIDPFNEVEAERGNMTETEYVGRCLQRARSFCNRYGCNVWIIAHPAKMQPPKPGEKIAAPGPYDIAGSANWANKSDLGITIHTPGDITTLHLWKSRFSRWGRKGAMAEMEYDALTSRYTARGQINQRLPYKD